jgi:uncharacterized protein YjeT (DUF2065 family)
MDLTTRIEIMTATLLLIIGLSHLVCSGAWSALFDDLLKSPYCGLWIGLSTLPLGLLLVMTHNVWVPDLTVIVTILGWSWTAKGTLYMLAPGLPARRFNRIVKRPRHFVYAGVGLCILGLAVLAGAWPASASFV